MADGDRRIEYTALLAGAAIGATSLSWLGIEPIPSYPPGELLRHIRRGARGDRGDCRSHVGGVPSRRLYNVPGGLDQDQIVQDRLRRIPTSSLEGAGKKTYAIHGKNR